MRQLVYGIGLCGLAFLAANLCGAQPPEGRRGFGPPGAPFGPGGPGGPGGHPLLMLLDTDRNGELSSEEIAAAADALRKLDRNNDGKLTLDELPRQPFMRPGSGGQPAPEQEMSRLGGMDRNNDGKITKDELPERMQEYFSRLDANGDGSLDREELRQLYRRMGEQAAGGPTGNLIERLRGLDANGDGKISREEAPTFGLFERLDTNNDGFIDKEEAQAAAERMRERGGEPRKRETR